MRLSGSERVIVYLMSVSSWLHQCGVRPGMMITSPLVTRRLTPPSMRLPRTVVLFGSRRSSTNLPPVTSVPAPSTIW